MIIHLCTTFIVFCVCTFMIKHIYIFQTFIQVWNIFCITTISVGTCLVCWFCQLRIRNNFSIFICPVCPSLYIIYLADWYIITVHHFSVNMPTSLFFFEKITTCWYTKLQSNTFYNETSVFINNSLLGCMYILTFYFQLNSSTK